MQKLEYAEIQLHDQREARERERLALDRSITLMELAAEGGATHADATKAIVFTSKLWTVLVEDLADPGNGLPGELRAKIVSIGIWILRELERLRNGETRSFDDLVVVSKAIRDGLL